MSRIIKVLLVEDDANLNELIQEGLTKHGFDVVTSESGNDALGVLADQDFNIMVTDLYMSDGGGQQLLNWCKENKPKMKLLAISGEMLDSIVTALDVVEQDGIVTMEKPFTVAKLSEVLKGMHTNNFF